MFAFVCACHLIYILVIRHSQRPRPELGFFGARPPVLPEFLRHRPRLCRHQTSGYVPLRCRRRCIRHGGNIRILRSSLAVVSVHSGLHSVLLLRVLLPVLRVLLPVLLWFVLLLPVLLPVVLARRRSHPPPTAQAGSARVALLRPLGSRNEPGVKGHRVVQPAPSPSPYKEGCCNKQQHEHDDPNQREHRPR